GTSDYKNNEDKTLILTPSETSKMVKLTFDLFNTESNNDLLYIYDGPSTSSPLIATLTGLKTTPFAYNATNAEGTLTLRFTSSNYTTRSGFKAAVTCVSIPNAPSNVNLVSATEHTIKIGWTDNSADETKFQILYATAIDGTYLLAGEVNPDVIEFEHTGLTSKTSYFYKVRAVNNDLTSAYSPVFETSTEGIAAPTLTSISSPAAQTITINWQDNDINETGFVIERSLEPSANFSQVGTVEADVTTFDDITVDYGVIYYYRVYAVNNLTQSELSASASFMAGSVITSNTEVVRCNYILLDPGGINNYSNNENKTIVLSPSEPDSKVKLNFAEFRLESGWDNLIVYNGSSTSAPQLASLTGSTLPADITATNAEGKLTLKFTSDGSSVYSGYKINVSCIIPIAAPTNLIATSTTRSTTTISWTDNSDNETKFEIYRSNTIDGEYTKVSEVAENVVEYTDTDLASGTAYYYKVTSANSVFASGYSNTLEITTLGVGMPVFADISSPTNTSIVLTLTPSGTAGTSLVIQRSVNPTTGFESIATLGASETTYTDNAVEYNTAYYYRMFASTTIGNSDTTSVISMLAGAVIFSESSVTRCGYKILDPGGLNDYPESYQKTMVIYPSEAGKKVSVSVEQVDFGSGDGINFYDGTTTSATNIYMLYNTYAPTTPIQATNPDGALTLYFYSNSGTVAPGFKLNVNCVTPSEIPTNLTVLDSTAGSITIGWTDNSNNETSFLIYRSQTLNGTYGYIGQVDANVTQYTNTYLSEETTYYYKIRVVNAEATSALSEALAASTAGMAAVSNLSSSSPSNTTIELTWIDNSTRETGYSIERSSSANSGFVTIATIAANATSYTDNSLTANQAYYYRVYGFKDGEKALSSPTTGTIAGAVTLSNTTITNCNYTLLDPGNLMDYSNSLNKTMVLVPSEVGKVVKITFEEFRTESNWDFLYIYDGPSTTSTLINKISGAQQTPFSYAASNPDGVLTLRFTSDGSNISSGFKATVACISIPNAPSNLNVVSATTNSITIGWTDNSTDETKFQVYCASSVNGEYNLVGEVSANVTQFTHNGLASGTTYFYKVKATNTDASSPLTNAIEAKTGGIAAPVIVSLASPDNQTISINWQRKDISETGFVIERSLEANANFAELTTVAPDITSYSDNTVTFGTTYYYRIYAVNATEESDRSEASYFVAGAVLMSNTEVNRCNYIIFDSGNSLGSYSNNENYTMLLTPQTAESAVKLTFESFATETDNDILYVYDGASTSDPLIATLRGNQVPSPIHATNPTGQLTLRFISNGSNNQAGFKIAASCINQVAAPTDLAVQSATGSSITLFWRDNTEYELGYKVYRASSLNGDFVEIGNVAQNVNTFTNENLTTGTTYYYIVKAWNNDYVSNASNTLEATTLGALAPTSLTAHAEGNSYVILNWTDNATTETGYIIERSLSATSGFEVVATIQANSVEYVDMGSVGTIYFYQVKAIADGIESAPTNVASVKAGYVSIFDGTSQGCDYYLLDPGGEANYGSNEDKTITLNPMVAEQKVKLLFQSFNLENNFDHLYIFDGPTVNDPLIATLTGTTLPDSIWATNPTGSLTLQFVSDGLNVREGFLAKVACIYIPEGPTNLTLVSATNSSIAMSWTSNDHVMNEFVVYRSLTENGTYEAIANTSRLTLSYTDENLETGTQYFYKVYASFYGHHSDNSANLAAATTGCRAPSELAVVSTTVNNAELTWADNSFNETGFTIERSLQATDGFEVVGTASANVTTYTDTNLESEQTYYYRVKATTDTEQSEYTSVVSVVVGAQIINDAEIVRCNYTILDNGGLNNYINNKTSWATLTPSEAGKTIKLRVSEFSIEANKDYLALYNGGTAQSPMVGAYTGTAIPDTLWATNTDGKLHLRLSADATNNASGFRIYVGCVDKLAAPTNLVQAVVTKAEVNLQWTDNSQNELGFKVYRSVVSNTGYTEIASLEANANGYVDSNTENGKTYYYKVLAYNKEITSGYSNTLTVVAGPNTITND
ncbi:MAG: fibronectin type III domain-containing protein, partial [Tenuifilaceae bacterium]|nr:fibronectin type III domain-containing protein [Tenuifilaceae bacterium]